MATAIKLVAPALVDPAKDEFPAMTNFSGRSNHGLEMPPEA
jgi:hypothetical protein